MNKILLLKILLVSTLFSIEIPTQKVEERAFAKSVELNAKVVQLSNAKQALMSQVSGHIEKYYVKAGQKVKFNQKIALIKSILLSKMTAEFISL